MADRLTDADLDAIERAAKWDAGSGWDEDILALVAEVRRLRAVRDAATAALAAWGLHGRTHERPDHVATAMHKLAQTLKAEADG